MTRIIRHGIGSVRFNPILVLTAFNRETILNVVADTHNAIFISPGGMEIQYAQNNLTHVEVTSDEELYDVLTALQAGPEVVANLFGHPVTTVIFDGFVDLQGRLLADRAAGNGRDVASFDDWSWLSNHTKAIISSFGALKDYTIVVSGTSDQDEFVKPGLIGSVSKDINSFVDYNFFVDLEVRQDSFIPSILTKPSIRYPWILDSFGGLPPIIPKSSDNIIDRLIAGHQGRVGSLPESSISHIQQPAPAVQTPVETGVGFVPTGMGSDEEILATLENTNNT